MKYGVSHSLKEETLEERLIEALESIDFVNALIQFELPDDRPLFKTVRVLEQK